VPVFCTMATLKRVRLGVVLIEHICAENFFELERKRLILIFILLDVARDLALTNICANVRMSPTAIRLRGPQR
jgi:hypothetical protein